MRQSGTESTSWKHRSPANQGSRDAFKKTKAREGSKVRDGYAPIKGPFPGADKPLSVVQVDHTLVDIILG